MKTKLLFLLLCATISFNGWAQIINDVALSLDATKPQHVISKYMNGSHFVYGGESDNVYKDERIADWMRASKVGMIRWPGGTAVMSYHWDALTGDNFGPDRWDTANYVEKNISPAKYMDLDEYITYCRRVNAEPMVGVNIKSGRKFRTDADGLDEARRLIQYCKDKNYNVKHWYMGNEGYANNFGSTSLYAQYIDMYAKELKKVDPDIVIIGDWKFGPEDKNRYSQTMQIVQASTELDVMELHEKWGEGWGLVTGNTLAAWKSDIPLFNGRFDYFCKKFRTDASNLGKTTKLSMNEWGIGDIVDGNDYHYALLAADYMTQIYKNDIYSACYWNLNIGGGKSRIFKTKNSNQDFDKFNPVEKVFRQYAPLLGGNYLEIVSSDNKVYGVASINKANDTIQVLILNKSAEKSRVKFTLNNFIANNTVLSDWFDELGNSMTEVLANSDSGYVLPAYSFTRLQFTGTSVPATPVPAISITSIPTSTQVGTNLVVTYKYTATTASKVTFLVTKNGGANASDVISTVASAELNPTAVGTDITGTFTVPIPAGTTPTANLTGNENYRIAVVLKDAINTTLAGDYSNTNYNFTPKPAISITSIPTTAQVGTNLVVSYKYTINSPGRVKINVTKNGGATPYTFISTVAFAVVNPATAGTDVTGTFTLPIPAGTTPTSSLTGNENYRIKIELFKADDTWLVGNYDNINYVFTPSLGIDDNNLVGAISVYPNPVDSVLNIKNASSLSNASFSISNVLGKTVVQSKELNDTVDVSNLSSGIYILSVKSDEGVKHIKFQKK